MNNDYYLQTISHLTNEGWVKGIANLEPRFALGSSFHVLSATTSYQGSLPLLFNALLFSLMVFRLFECVQQDPPKRTAFWLPLSRSALPFAFLLIPSQSPALMGIVLVALVFEQLFLHEESRLPFSYLLLGSALLLKPTVALSLTILIFFWHLYSKKWSVLLRHSYWFILPVLVLPAKNLWLSAYPLFPLQAWPVDWPGKFLLKLWNKPW
ncbi:MAG: hypothetical protein U5L96_17245 [Owenweeksia sp.]|nr:hypothetical protein [Owenweeksia sp.]